MELKEFNLEDLESIHAFLSTLESENGLENKFYGLTLDQFKEVVPAIQDEAAGINLIEGRVPQTLYFLWDQGHIVALFKVRHKLNEALLMGSGHIGYGVAKQYRRQGYASTGLGMVCKQCLQLVEEDDYLLSCNKDNIASFKVMMNNLGYLHHDDTDHHYVRIRKSLFR